MASKPPEERLTIPSTGMRGGLGRTLLTAFLIMTIAPLAILSWYAARSGRRNIEKQVMAKLSTVATVTELRIRAWTDSREEALDILCSSPDVRRDSATVLRSEAGAYQARQDLIGRLDAFAAAEPAFTAVALLDDEHKRVVSVGAPPDASTISDWVNDSDTAEATFRLVSLAPEYPAGAVILRSVTSSEGESAGTLVGWVSLSGISALLESVGSLGEGGQLYLVDGSGASLPAVQGAESQGVTVARAKGQAEGFYDGGGGVSVVGVYRSVPELGLVLAAEQRRDEALFGADRVTAAIVAAALIVALVTSVIAAVVTRKITDPVVRLTESALRVAQGDLDARVDVDSRDEIGILAGVFNRMVADLQSLYQDLEAKVARRTSLLREANETIQRRAVHLATTVEIGRAVTSILDPGDLLREVVQLVHEQFDYPYVGVYLLGDDGEPAVLEAGTGSGSELNAVKGRPVTLQDEGAVSRALRSREAVMERWTHSRRAVPPALRHIGAEIALPLTVRDDILGVLDILTVDPERIDEDTLSILRSVASQVAIALDNARAYRNEHEARERLREAEAMRSRFLTHMSRELREPLTNIIGFCRLILNGLDGPITDQQRGDLQIIYANSEHLLGLINDLLDVSQIEAGLVELQFEDVDLDAMTKSVMATASALVRDKDIQLHREVEQLPEIRADATRIRQVLLKLLTNAAKFTDEGSITVRAWSQQERVFVSVADTGLGIAEDDRSRVFERFEQGANRHGQHPDGIGLGLALSKEFVEMHGGDIWVESEPGVGSVFTFSLPVDPGESAARGNEH